MLNLKAFHLFFIGLAIVLTSGFGFWGLFNHYPLLGSISLVVGIVLVFYAANFARKAEKYS
jgi:hypothetical protein